MKGMRLEPQLTMVHPAVLDELASLLDGWPWGGRPGTGAGSLWKVFLS